MINFGRICSQENCDKNAHCKGMCNGHYLRYRRGIDAAPPIRQKEKGRKCKIDGCYKKHYGSGFCVNHWKAWNRQSIKKKLIELMGGKCGACNEVFHPASFDFHHTDPKKKDFSITNAFNNKTFDDIKKEAEKCILLCANCHRIEHAGEQYA